MYIHVSNISVNVIDADLQKLFAAYGEVYSIVILRDKLNGRSKGTAMIDMLNARQGWQAIQCLDGAIIDGQPIMVTEIKYSIRNNKN
jgi:RNA recognition motif-containing protein